MVQSLYFLPNLNFLNLEILLVIEGLYNLYCFHNTLRDPLYNTELNP